MRQPFADHERAEVSPILVRMRCWNGSYLVFRNAMEHQVVTGQICVRDLAYVVKPGLNRASRGDDTRVAIAAKHFEAPIEFARGHPSFDNHQSRARQMVWREERIDIPAREQQGKSGDDQQQEPSPDRGEPDLPPANEDWPLHAARAALPSVPTSGRECTAPDARPRNKA